MDKGISVSAAKEQMLLSELDELRMRYSNLRRAFQTFVHEAHCKCLDGITECDHLAGIFYCTYHTALRKAQELLALD